MNVEGQIREGMNDKGGRRSIRLPGYDYSQAGAYFITLVAQDRAVRFGEIRDGEMVLNPAGEMIRAQWEALPARFPRVELDEYVIMPNHFHAVLVITDVGTIPVGAALMAAHHPVAAHDNWAGTRPAPTENTISTVGSSPAPTDNSISTTAPTLGNILGAFKSITTHEYILAVNHHGWPRFNKRLWQRNYYEHIVRSAAELDRIREYIRCNPLRWNEDHENPASQIHP